MIKCYLIVALGSLIFGAACLPFGFTRDFVKPDNVSPGHSFGIVYPNDWGHNAFLVMITTWYLYLRRKPVITFAFFWAMTAFMYFVISCRTIALLTAVFPFFALLVGWLTETRNNKKRHKMLGIIFIVFPLICLAISYLLAWKFEYVHGLFYQTPLHTLAMRFVQGGIAMRYFGFPLIGITEMKIEGEVYALLNDAKVKLTVMDNAYISYTITRGVLWMIMCIGWLIFANARAWKRRDYHLMLLSIILSGFAMMEWAGLNAWYNIMLLYPLALVAEENGKPAAAIPDQKLDNLNPALQPGTQTDSSDECAPTDDTENTASADAERTSGDTTASSEINSTDKADA